PEVMTVFSLPMAEQVSLVCRALGRTQKLLLRVARDGDYFYPGQEGGIPLGELAECARRICDLPGLVVAGVTSFPCLLYNYERQEVERTPNLETLIQAASILRETVGLHVEQVNAPGSSCVATFPMLRDQGVTHAEPGSSLTGHTPLHAFSDQPESPAMVYVSEITHIAGDKAYCVGGGFYSRSRVSEALVGSEAESIIKRLVKVEPLPPGYIDYYGTLIVPQGMQVRIGDTVVFAFRSQVFATRAKVAVVGGIHCGNAYLAGLFDHTGRSLTGAETHACVG
ncbi:MAG: alanine racemase, partial [Bacillota bacterium]